MEGEIYGERYGEAFEWDEVDVGKGQVAPLMKGMIGLI
jgi:hypothetical protein